MATPTPPDRDPLGLALKQTEAKLVEKLEEACPPESHGVTDESTAELAKLSDTLLAAARAAKDVIVLRQRRRKEQGTTEDAAEGGEGEAIREFTDREGKAWRVWAVTPTLLRASKREGTLGEFEHGWLAFETLDEEVRRRLPHYPADWVTMPEAKLQELLARATEARTRLAELPKRPDSRSEPGR